MSMFRKPKKTIQRRVFSTVEDEEDSDNKESPENTNNDEPTTVDNENDLTDNQADDKIKKKKHKSKDKGKDIGRTLLSFNDDEENVEVFKVKKSSHSKKVMRQLDRERKRKKKQLVTEDSTGDQVDVQEDGRIKIQTDDLEIILKQTEIRNVNSNDEISDKDYLSGDDGFNNPTHLFSHPATVKDALERGKIPDAAMIHAARKKRQEAREFGDFIPLKENVSKSRLVREDGDGDGSDEDEDRVDMAVNTQSKDRAERSEKFYEAQDMLYSKESDTELDEWENQQIRKGVTGSQLANAQQETYQFYLQAPDEDCTLKTSQLRQAYASAGIAPISDARQSSFEDRTLTEIENNLMNRIKQVREAHLAHSQDLAHLSEDMMNLRIETKVAEKKIPDYKRRFKFYQEMRGYIGDLVECLDEKLPCIVHLEQRFFKYQQNEIMFLVDRRRQDVSDQVSSDKSRNNNDEKFLQRSAEREGRRTRRRRAREKNGTQQSHVDGMSSDDEIPDQREVENRQQLEVLLSDAAQVFSDACKEFASLRSVLECFEEWMREDPETYEDSYVTLCIPKVISPYVRLELVGWNPFRSNKDIEKMDWYNVLALFGSNNQDSDVKHDEVNMLIPIVIVKIILPKLVDIIELWDPLSTSQTLRVVSLLTKLCKDYPTLQPSCKPLVRVFEVVVERIKWAIDHDVYIPLVSKQNEFSQRQFASGVKLLHNILSFQGVVVDNKLMNIAFDLLLNRYLIPIIRICKASDAAEKLNCVTNTLPRIWLQRTGLTYFEPIKQCATNVLQQLSKANLSDTQAIETINLVMKTLNM